MLTGRDGSGESMSGSIPLRHTKFGCAGDAADVL
jgi:hypothetical protein